MRVYQRPPILKYPTNSPICYSRKISITSHLSAAFMRVCVCLCVWHYFNVRPVFSFEMRPCRCGAVRHPDGERFPLCRIPFQLRHYTSRNYFFIYIVPCPATERGKVNIIFSKINLFLGYLYGSSFF